MILSKEDLIAKIDGLDIADEIKVELMEDITDSFEVTPDDEKEEMAVIETVKADLEKANNELVALQEKHNDLLKKYKDRFLGIEVEEDVEEAKKEDEELEEKEIVDIKSI